jgi:hypothetical protein
MKAKAPLPSVRLSRTVGADETYDPTANAVRGAEVEVQRLTADSTVEASLSYSERDSVPGLYTPIQPVLVESQVTYRLHVETTENDTAVYQSEAQPAFTVDLPRREQMQNVFTFTTTSLLDFRSTPDSLLRQSLTPFYRDGYDPEEDSLSSLRISSSGLLNEGNFERNADETITIRLPWLAVAFFGPNEVGINVVDDNYYDFLRSQQVQQGGFAPGEIPNVIEHVEGGTGIFGSYATAAHPSFIQPPSRPNSRAMGQAGTHGTPSSRDP